MPCRQLFMLDRARPALVRGPVERLLFIRLAMSCFSEIGFIATRYVLVSAMAGSPLVLSRRRWGRAPLPACQAATISIREEICVCWEIFTKYVTITRFPVNAHTMACTTLVATGPGGPFWPLMNTDAHGLEKIGR